MYKDYIHHVRVPIWPIRRAGNWVYLAGSCREATPHFITTLIVTINVEIFAQYIFSRMALYARKYYVSEKINQTSTHINNSNLRENLVARKCSLMLYARKFSCAKMSTFTVLEKMKQ